jgi:hypothetical protein
MDIPTKEKKENVKKLCPKFILPRWGVQTPKSKLAT